MMRITTGLFRGHRLIENKFEHVRPTTDKVRQAIFTKLQFFVPEKRVLDLFCGTGAMGVEALSRGAAKVVFVDKEKWAKLCFDYCPCVSCSHLWQSL